MTKQPANIVFFAAEPVEIVGYEHGDDVQCSHCGRPLKVGVKLAGFAGSFGADCLAKAAVSQNYHGKKWRYDAATLRERAIVVGKGQKCMERHGIDASRCRFVLRTPLHSI